MTREVLKEYWDIIEAFKNGEDIQYLAYDSQWRDTDVISEMDSVKHRIKPNPEYVPFDYSDAPELIGHAIKHRNAHETTMIVSIDEIPYSKQVKLGNREPITFLKLLSDYVFLLDGSPCGKLK